jgi:hypothetical protein
MCKIYALMGTVDHLETKLYIEGEKLKADVTDLKYRVKDIENYCCPDKIIH